MTQSKDFYSVLAVLLRVGRRAAGLTQQELGVALNKEQPWVSKIESGELEIDIPSLKLWAACIGYDLETLILATEIICISETETVNQVEKLFNEDISIQLSILPSDDRKWTNEHWRFLINQLRRDGLFEVKDMASLILGNLNPPQVGTSIASKKSFQSHFEPRKTWQNVRAWFYRQTGKCADCGTRLDLQADHVNPRVKLGDAADTLDNLTLRCRRCNVIRRESHKNGGLTYLTAEAALMWLLFVKRPQNYKDYEKMCREYGLTMANIRFQEAWAMAEWLAKEKKYTIEN